MIQQAKPSWSVLFLRRRSWLMSWRRVETWLGLPQNLPPIKGKPSTQPPTPSRHHHPKRPKTDTFHPPKPRTQLPASSAPSSKQLALLNPPFDHIYLHSKPSRCLQISGKHCLLHPVPAELPRCRLELGSRGFGPSPGPSTLNPTLLRTRKLTPMTTQPRLRC